VTNNSEVQITPVVDALSTRLFDWSVTNLGRELEMNCPLLRKAGAFNRWICAFTEWNCGLGAGERRMVTMALAKRGNLYAAQRLRRATSAEEKEIVVAMVDGVNVQLRYLPPLRNSANWPYAISPGERSECLAALRSELSGRSAGRTTGRKSSLRAFP
jgi:hypothetical protein